MFGIKLTTQLGMILTSKNDHFINSFGISTWTLIYKIFFAIYWLEYGNIYLFKSNQVILVKIDKICYIPSPFEFCKFIGTDNYYQSGKNF
ncbi:hypothetical protein GCM10007916_10240 [Psychromonas marina]|uniref:Uncharacterized protein n=1 Tax=Psychromonas marina TaxID=88364 RepID=A0ABQ6DXX7_9GAMM|nr:hypothetical protein GCM10007916_10240 [Psychromonas marina]